MFNNRPIHAIPLTTDQWEAAGVGPLYQKNDYNNYFWKTRGSTDYGRFHDTYEVKACYYNLVPHLRALVESSLDITYGLEMFGNVVHVVTSEFNMSHGRWVAGIVGFDTIVTSHHGDRRGVREFLTDRGMRFVETGMYVGGRYPFHIECENTAVEIMMSFDDIEIKKSKARDAAIERIAGVQPFASSRFARASNPQTNLLLQPRSTASECAPRT